MPLKWATGMCSRMQGGKRVEWREWLAGDYVIALCLGNELSSSAPSKLGLRRTQLDTTGGVFELSHRGKFLEDATSLQEAKDLAEVDAEFREKEES